MALVTPLFLPTKTYPFQRLRDMLLELGLQEGVYGATDFKASQRAAGADRSVDVAPGALLLVGDDTSRQGAYKHYNDGDVNVPATPNTSGTDRVDQLVLQNYDSSILGSSDTPLLMILAGTPTAGCQVSTPGGAGYRAGAAALPNSAVRLAEWVAPNAYTQITTAMIVDRRPAARGAYSRIRSISGGVSTQSTSFVEVGGGLSPPPVRQRVECGGLPVNLRIRGRLQTWSNTTVYLQPWADGATIESVTDWQIVPQIASVDWPVDLEYEYAPSVGSHLFSWAWRSTGGTGANFVSFQSAVGTPLDGVVEELVSANFNAN